LLPKWQKYAQRYNFLTISTQIIFDFLGEPLRAHFIRARVGLSAPSLIYSPLRAEYISGSASIPLAGKCHFIHYLVKNLQTKDFLYILAQLLNFS